MGAEAATGAGVEDLAEALVEVARARAEAAGMAG